MKKILTIIIALTLVLVISGCDDIELKKTEEYYCENDYNGEWNNTFQQCIFETYSQEEVRNLIDSLIESSEYKTYVDMNFEMNKLYTQEEVDELLRQDRVKGAESDLYVLAMVDDDFYTKAEMIVYINELEERIEILEGE